jgi:hypothetical protein
MTTDKLFTLLRRGLLMLVALLAALQGSVSRLHAETAGSAGRFPRAIVVHGHWTIDVVRRDGTLVSHNEFENALQPAGAAFIATALATTLATSPTGTIFNGKWRIAVTAVQPGTPPCRFPNAGLLVNGPCVMVDPLDTIGGTASYKTATVTTVGGKLVLTGSADVINPTSIGLVVTFPSSMGFSTTAFDTNSTEGFTRAVLATPIPVLADQTVKVRVEISFF